jgi:para-aminobenzoate synthetase component 1
MNGQLTRLLPYQADITLLAAKLLDLPFPMLLDSCNHNPSGGRYDIISAAPVATLEMENASLLCSEPLPVDRDSDPLAAASWLLQRYQPEDDAGTLPPLPFDGGLLGFLGYPKLSDDGAIKVDQGFLGIYTWALVVDHLQRETRLFFRSNCPAETRQAVLERLHTEVTQHLDFELTQEFSTDLSRLQYERSFQRVKDYIEAGDCYQVNLTQRFSGRFRGHSFPAYRRLRSLSGKPFSAYFSWRDKSLLCLSPERFIRVDQQQVMTQPIKGTRPRSADPAQDQRLAEELLDSDKDRAENLMIVDLLRNDLGTSCEVGSIHVPKLFDLQTFDNVYHLVSTVCGTLPENVSPLELFRKCYPGGSITGAPKLRAMEIIDELESNRREVYCGNVLYLGFNGRMDSNITIRTLYCRGEEIYCWAGGGIVADSDCDQEYRECFDKIYKLISILQDTSLIIS